MSETSGVLTSLQVEIKTVWSVRVKCASCFALKTVKRGVACPWSEEKNVCQAASRSLDDGFGPHGRRAG
jgi:hypothetical protein